MSFDSMHKIIKDYWNNQIYHKNGYCIKRNSRSTQFYKCSTDF